MRVRVRLRLRICVRAFAFAFVRLRLHLPVCDLCSIHIACDRWVACNDNHLQAAMR